MPTSTALVGLLAEPARLRVVSALALGARTQDDVVKATGLDPREAGAALRRLQAGGLISTVDGELRVREELFKEAARAEAPPRPAADEGVSDPATAAVLRAFVRDGQLRQMPAARSKRRILLEHIATVFEPGVRYPEKDVDAVLRTWYADYASLRRYLVDEQLLARESGEYWRIGGWVDVQARTEPAVQREQRVAVYGLATEGDQVLLARLSRGMHRGLWTLPGGGLDFGERPVVGVRREFREETGLDVTVTDLLDVDAEQVEFVRNGRPVHGHPIRILYRVGVVGGSLTPEVDGSTDVAAWWRRSDLVDVPLTPYAATAVHTGRISAG